MLALRTTGFIIVVAAAVLGNTSAYQREEVNNMVRSKVIPAVLQCARKLHISLSGLKAALETANLGSLDPCLLTCTMKKLRLMNEAGFLDLPSIRKLSEKYASQPQERALFEQVIEKCSSVNDLPVGDGSVGCERAKFLFLCLVENQGMFIMHYT